MNIKSVTLICNVPYLGQMYLVEDNKMANDTHFIALSMSVGILSIRKGSYRKHDRGSDSLSSNLCALDTLYSLN